MSFPKIKRARVRKLVKARFSTGRNRSFKLKRKGTGTITGRSLKEERLSRARWCRAIAKAIDIESEPPFEEEPGRYLTRAEERAIAELLRVAELDSK